MIDDSEVKQCQCFPNLLYFNTFCLTTPFVTNSISRFEDRNNLSKMIVVFVIDTSPSMRQPLSENDRSAAGGGMSRLDLAKMAVEDIVRGLNKRVNEHNTYLHQHPSKQQSLRNIGQGFSPNDQFLLLSTGRQHTQQPATAACGAGGRLLVGYGDHSHEQATDGPNDHPGQHQSNMDNFQKELKRLQASNWDPGKVGPNSKPIPFPEDGGGSVGLNTAISVGLQMLSRYRLNFRATENFGMGRLPSPAVLNPSGGPTVHSLQPASLIIITDGVCLRSPPTEGGGSLQLQYGNMLLREFYQEPFRWDQRIFCLGVGGKEGVKSTQFFHPHLRALCEVTGGSHMMLRSSGTLAQSTGSLLKKIAPPRPRDLPIPDPLKLQASHAPLVGAMGTFVSGGPVCSLRALEGDLDTGQAPPKHRALLLYVPHEHSTPPSSSSTTSSDPHPDVFQPPTWCIPESFFPTKSLDTLPPRSAQPNLLFSRFPGRLGSKSFEPSVVLKALSRLDQLVLSNRKHSMQPYGQVNQAIRLLSRDVYVLEWISTDGKPAKGPLSPMSMDYFPVVVSGAARPSLGEGDSSFLNIGILHIPSGSSTLEYSLTSGTRVSTLTLLPPEPHVLLPLLIRAAEAEQRALKKIMAAEGKDSATGGAPSASLLKKQAQASRNVHLDEHWRNEFRAYLFRIPPYYQNALRRSLRSVLPASAHSLLTADGTEGGLASQCFSKACLQKIRNAEQSARENNERLERQEAELRRRGSQTFEPQRLESQPHPRKRFHNEQANGTADGPLVGYGQYDPRSSTDSFLAALKGLPAPWRVGATLSKPADLEAKEVSPLKSGSGSIPCKAVDALGDLPANCLMAYYESRRRWIFGGSGLTTRGLFAEGVVNDGSNMQQCGAIRDAMEESLLSVAGVGVSQLNATSTARMGDYRERLLWSRAPVVGYGSNDAAGVSATTAANGAPKWSVDNDAMPMTFFNPKTGEFSDSVQARVRSRLMVNFGNPYKDKRADSLVPDDYLSHSPSNKKGLGIDDGMSPMTPPGSPPHGSYAASEGEGEAVFANPASYVRKSPSKSESDGQVVAPEAKKQRIHPDAAELPSMPHGTPKGQPQRTEKKGERLVVEAPKPPPPPKTSNLPSIPPPPPPPPKSQPPSKTPQSQNGSTKARPPGPPGAKGPPPAKPPPKGPPHRGTAGERPPPPPTRPGEPAPKPEPRFSSAAPQAQSNKAVVPQVKKPAPPSTGPDMQSPDKKPNVDLPAGWMTVWSKSQKRWYFFCTKTNKSVWQWPPP